VIALPENQEVASFSEKGESMLSLSPENEIVGMIDEFIKKLF
jgi:hypothetical protein